MIFLLLGDVGGQSYYHVGDEAIMTARVDWLRQNFPEAQLLIYSKKPTFTSKIHGCSSIAVPATLKKNRFLYKLPWRVITIFTPQIKCLAKWLRITKLEQLVAVCSVDLLWFCGGGNINSSCSGLVQLRTTLAHIAIACDVPVIVTGQTIGPELNHADSQLLRSWLPKVHTLGVRDQKNSVELAKSLGVSTK